MLDYSQRAEIRLGFRCNARCGFCYYQDLLDNPKDKEPTTAQLIEYLNVLHQRGVTEVEFTGGEPTIRSDLLELAAHAKALGFVNISIITNGLRLANTSFAEKLVVAGVNDFLFSIHGHTESVHDMLTNISGSFKKILQAVNNVKSLGVRCRCSTTVTGRNYMHIESILKMCIEMNFQCIHLAVFSPVADAKSTDTQDFVPYEDAAEAIKRGIDQFEDLLPPLSIKYIPFCFFKGYEKYVMNLYQQSFDPDDWNYYQSNKSRRAGTPFKSIAFDFIALAGSLLAKDWSVPLKYGWYGLKVAGFTRIVELLRKKRLPVCRHCRYDIVCDHVWKGYINHYGSAGIVPVGGKKIRHPAWSYVMTRYRKPGSQLPIYSNKNPVIPVTMASADEYKQSS